MIINYFFANTLPWKTDCKLHLAAFRPPVHIRTCSASRAVAGNSLVGSQTFIYSTFTPAGCCVKRGLLFTDMAAEWKKAAGHSEGSRQTHNHCRSVQDTIQDSFNPSAGVPWWRNNRNLGDKKACRLSGSAENCCDTERLCKMAESQTKLVTATWGQVGSAGWPTEGLPVEIPLPPSLSLCPWAPKLLPNVVGSDLRGSTCHQWVRSQVLAKRYISAEKWTCFVEW